LVSVEILCNKQRKDLTQGKFVLHLQDLSLSLVHDEKEDENVCGAQASACSAFEYTNTSNIFALDLLFLLCFLLTVCFAIHAFTSQHGIQVPY
jgi:hypothetical protein